MCYYILFFKNSSLILSEIVGRNFYFNAYDLLKVFEEAVVDRICLSSKNIFFIAQI